MSPGGYTEATLKGMSDRELFRDYLDLRCALGEAAWADRAARSGLPTRTGFGNKAEIKAAMRLLKKEIKRRGMWWQLWREHL